MNIWFYRCLSAFTFLTKIPIPYNPSIDDEDFHRNIIFFPLVGGILGIILHIIAWGLNQQFSSLMSAVLVLAFSVVLTGGLHLDGVGDSFDGLFSYRDKSRILEIMKDSRIGTNGILGIIFILMLKLVAFDELIKSMNYGTIILMPLVGRMAVVVACYNGKNARENGMGKTYIGNISKKDFFATIILSVALMWLYTFGESYSRIISIVAMVITLFCAMLTRAFVYKKIDGITGDILGLICESSEAIFIVLYLLLI